MIKSISLQFLIVAELIFHSLLFSQQKITLCADDSTLQLTSVELPHTLQRPRVALVLSGGGARGITHLGVIKALEEAGIKIDFIVGTSMGSVIGGLYASGYSTQEMQMIVDSTQWAYILSLTDDTNRGDLYLSQKVTADKKQLTIRFDGLKPILPSSISSGQRLTNFINQLTLQSIYHPINSFADLKIPFYSVATDLITGKKVVFNSGSLSEALRASISVPLLYSTIKKDTLELTDGGLVSNIPVDVAKEHGADIIIAVDVSSPLRTAEQLTTPWEIADQIINIMANPIKQQLLHNATVVVTPDIGAYPATNFTDLNFLITQGYYGMKRELQPLKDSISTFLKSNSNQTLYDSTLTIDSLSYRILPEHCMDGNNDLRPFHTGTTTLKEIWNYIFELHNNNSFRDVHAEITQSGLKTDLCIKLLCNPTIRSVNLTGMSTFDSSELEQFYQPLIGKPLNNSSLVAANESLLRFYRNNGMSLTRVFTAFDSTAGRLSVTVNEGIISSIHFVGKKITRDWVIRRELPFKSGDIFTIQNATQALVNLYATNLFEQVLIDIGYEGNNPSVVIHFEEKKSDLIRMGMRVDNERNLQPSIEIRNDNILGTATESGLSFAGGGRNRKLLFDIKANRIFNSYFTAGLNIYHSFKDIYTYGNNPNLNPRKYFSRVRIGEYRQILYGGSFTLGRQVERFGTVSAEYRLEANAIHFLDGIGYTPEEYSLQALKLNSLIDTQDSFPFARNGSMTRFSWETATSSLKSIVGNIGYSKIFFSYEWFSSLSFFTLHPKFQIGFGDRTLPLAQQFSWGGEDSFYGLFEDDMRGRQIFLSNIELRTRLPFKVLWDTYFHIRYDFGNIWPQQENISTRDFHHGIGLGFAVDTPLGPASFSIGRSFYIRRDLLDEPLTLGPIIIYASFGYPLQ
ncbi:MAG: patatin-like phospholipase family protein [Bacteroidetes bacterium]|nr:patatin-like phospholipase family protein [Bacteroidota bacterium]